MSRIRLEDFQLCPEGSVKFSTLEPGEVFRYPTGHRPMMKVAFSHELSGTRYDAIYLHNGERRNLDKDELVMRMHTRLTNLGDHKC